MFDLFDQLPECLMEKKVNEMRAVIDKQQMMINTMKSYIDTME